MSIKAEFMGRKAYKLHVEGNQASDRQDYGKAKEKHAAAAQLYAQAVAAGCSKPVILMAYGVLLLRLGRYQEAKDIMLNAEKNRALTKEERKQLRLNYAVCCWKMGELDHAIELFKYSMQDGKNSMIYGSLGFLLIEKAKQTGDFSEAQAFNAEALDYDDEDAVVLDNIGQMHLAMGEKEKALEYFTKAHAIKPHQVDTLYYLAKIAAEDGDKAGAREHLENAIKGNYSALCTTTKEMAQSLLDTL